MGGPPFLFVKLHFVCLFVFLRGRIIDTAILDRRLEGRTEASHSHLCSWDEQGELEKVKQRAFLPEMTRLCEKSSLLDVEAPSHQNNRSSPEGKEPTPQQSTEGDPHSAAFQANSFLSLHPQPSAPPQFTNALLAVFFFLLIDSNNTLLFLCINQKFTLNRIRAFHTISHEPKKHFIAFNFCAIQCSIRQPQVTI